MISTTDIIDPIFLFIIGISVAMLLGITGFIIYFVIRYNRKRCPVPTSDVASNIGLEVVWTLIPTLLVLAMFYYGWAGFLALRNVPEGAMVVDVTGRMWSWSFAYENGKTSDRLQVPVGQPIKVRIHSTDVLHSFYIPAFRVKRDAVPGMETYVWFTATEPGSYDIFCAEYCGLQHAAMITTVEAMPKENFDAWYAASPSADSTAQAREILDRLGCLGCHSEDGSLIVGPSFKGLFGRTVEVKVDGTEKTLTADEDYIRRSILEPEKEVVEDFSPIMPSYQGQISDEELQLLIDYFRQEAQPAAPKGPSGAELVQIQGCLGCHSTDGTPRVGPSFKGINNRAILVKRDGKEVEILADEAYLKRAITDPQAEVVKGFEPMMPPYPQLTEEELHAIVEYLEALK